MADHKPNIATGLVGALAQPDWRPGGEFTAADLRLEQSSRLQRLRRHLRLVHGSGVVCGLNVVSAGDPFHPWSLFLCPGYGIGPCGDEILVAERYRFDLRDYLWTMPLDRASREVWIAVEAEEIPDAFKPKPSCGCGCGCGEPDYVPSRLRDGFRIALYWNAPFSRSTVFDPCSGATPPCPNCPEACGLVVARVALPQSRDGFLPDSAIANLGGN